MTKCSLIYPSVLFSKKNLKVHESMELKYVFSKTSKKQILMVALQN